MDTTRPVRLKMSAAPLVIVANQEVTVMIDAVARSVRSLGNCPTCKAPTYIPCVTSGADGIHSAFSPHYRNLALDFRSSDWPLGSKDTILRALTSELDARLYRYVLETDHLHIECVPE